MLCYYYCSWKVLEVAATAVLISILKIMVNWRVNNCSLNALLCRRRPISFCYSSTLCDRPTHRVFKAVRQRWFIYTLEWQCIIYYQSRTAFSAQRIASLFSSHNFRVATNLSSACVLCWWKKGVCVVWETFTAIWVVPVPI